MAEETLIFGPFVLDPGRGILLREGQPVPLGQRALAVLAALAEAPGRTVSKADLLARAWPDTIVEEGNLTVQIAALRKALGPADGGQEWIVTVPRVGYRLVAPPGQAKPVAPPPTVPSLAVLPFADLGGNPDQAWFAEGVVEDIVTALSRFRSFAVVARSSTLAYRGRGIDVRQVARELGVRYLLDGSVRRSGDRLRITAQLVDGVSGAQLWARSFDGSLAEVFDFQDRLTEEVVMLVEPRIQVAEIERSRRERPGSVATYDVYLRALAGISSESAADNAEAYALLLAGLARDPDDPLLLSHAAWAIEHRNSMGWPPFGPDDRARCADFARLGLERAGGDAMIMAHCGMSLLQGAREYDWGMAVLQAAVEANPNNPMVLVRAAVAHLHCGDLDQALALVHRADRLSPGDPGAHFSLCVQADVALIRGQYAEALDFATRALARNPNFDATLWVLIAANAHLGRMAEARHHLDALLRLAPGVTVARIRDAQPAKDPTRKAAVLQGLRLAGLADQ
jgi:TolB-like protein